MLTQPVSVIRSPNSTGSSPEPTPDFEQRTFSFDYKPYQYMNPATSTAVPSVGPTSDIDSNSELRALVSDPNSLRLLQQRQYCTVNTSTSAATTVNVNTRQQMSVSVLDEIYDAACVDNLSLFESAYCAGVSDTDSILGGDFDRAEFDQYLTGGGATRLPSHELTDLLIHAGTVSDDLSSSPGSDDITDLTYSLTYSAF